MLHVAFHLHVWVDVITRQLGDINFQILWWDEFRWVYESKKKSGMNEKVNVCLSFPSTFPFHVLEKREKQSVSRFSLLLQIRVFIEDRVRMIISLVYPEESSVETWERQKKSNLMSVCEMKLRVEWSRQWMSLAYFFSQLSTSSEEMQRSRCYYRTYSPSQTMSRREKDDYGDEDEKEWWRGESPVRMIEKEKAMKSPKRRWTGRAADLFSSLSTVSLPSFPACVSVYFLLQGILYRLSSSS